MIFHVDHVVVADAICRRNTMVHILVIGWLLIRDLVFNIRIWKQLIDRILTASNALCRSSNLIIVVLLPLHKITLIILKRRWVLYS